MSLCLRQLLLLPMALAPVAGMADAGACASDQADRARALYEHLAANPGQDSGLPLEQAMPELSPWLSSALQADIETARSVQRRFMQAYPKDKPPYIEGSLFGSLFEGFNRVEGAQADPATTAGYTAVTLRLRYDPPADMAEATPVIWEDKVWMRCEQGQWRVDDVEYLCDWSFGCSHGTRLRDGLRMESL